MSLYQNKESKGFTLLEMLLVLVIMAAILVMIMNYVTQKTEELRRDRVSLQMQQILNAALAYYVDKGTWPKGTATGGCAAPWGSINILQTSGYLSNTANLVNPWGQGFCMSENTVDTSGNPVIGTFSVKTDVRSPTEAQIAAGRLPFGFVSDAANSSTSSPRPCPTGSTTCSILVSTISIPGQNLNNARSMNFAGVYTSGSCVPAPVCPGGMKPQIYVVPGGVSGVFDSNNPTIVYPINSFTAFARGKDLATGEPATYAVGPLDCSAVSPVSQSCQRFFVPGANPDWDPVKTDPNYFTTQKYWRVCLKVITDKGRVVSPPTTISSMQQGQNMGSLIVMTRCAPSTGDTPSGPPFGYFIPSEQW